MGNACLPAGSAKRIGRSVLQRRISLRLMLRPYGLRIVGGVPEIPWGVWALGHGAGGSEGVLEGEEVQGVDQAVEVGAGVVAGLAAALAEGCLEGEDV